LKICHDKFIKCAAGQDEFIISLSNGRGVISSQVGIQRFRNRQGQCAIGGTESRNLLWGVYASLHRNEGLPYNPLVMFAMTEAKSGTRESR
jgi:hypothetical protein